MKASPNRKMKKWLIVTCILAVIPFTLFVFYLLGIESIDIQERNDDSMLSTARNIGKQLYDYKSKNNQFPETLTQANIPEKACFILKCVKYKYKVSDDGQNFTLAAANGGWIAYYTTYGEIRGEYDVYGSGLAVSKKLAKERKDFPVYREDNKVFATPSAWPILESE